LKKMQSNQKCALDLESFLQSVCQWEPFNGAILLTIQHQGQDLHGRKTKNANMQNGQIMRHEMSTFELKVLQPFCLGCPHLQFCLL